MDSSESKGRRTSSNPALGVLPAVEVEREREDEADEEAE